MFDVREFCWVWVGLGHGSISSPACGSGWVGLGQLFGGLGWAGWVDENRPTDNSEVHTYNPRMHNSPKDVLENLQVIRDAGIILNLEKCDIGKPEVKLVGHIVGSGCRKADPERTQAVSETARPSTKRELRKSVKGTLYEKVIFLQFGGRVPSPCTDWHEFLFGQADPRAPRQCQISYESVERVAPVGRKC